MYQRTTLEILTFLMRKKTNKIDKAKRTQTASSLQTGQCACVLLSQSARYETHYGNSTQSRTNQYQGTDWSVVSSAVL
jgi:hypothetical protein